MSGNEIRELFCAECGAPLEPLADRLDVACINCGRRHASIPPPAATHNLSIGAGDRVAVEWGQRWWPARVIDIIEKEGYRVQFEGWGPAMEEIVAESMVRKIGEPIIPQSAVTHHPPPRGFGGKIARAPLPVKLLLGSALGVLSFVVGYSLVDVVKGSRPLSAPDISVAGMGNAPVDSRPLGANEALSEGQVVDVLWDGNWYPGRVLSLEGGGHVKVHYEGWDNKYDEVVKRNRIRIPE